jgi:hypothetical protein
MLDYLKVEVTIQLKNNEVGVGKKFNLKARLIVRCYAVVMVIA